MSKYLVKRLLRGLISIVIVVAVVMVLIYTLIDKEDIFKGDAMILKRQSNAKTIYKYEKWEEYGYLDYFPYADYLSILEKAGQITTTQRTAAAKIGQTEAKDSAIVKEYVEKFKAYCSSKGYTVVRLDADKSKLKNGGQQQLFAYKNTPTLTRLWRFFTGILDVDTIHYVENDEDLVGDRGLSFTFFDPVYGGKVFSPAIMGNGTKHKYLLYFDNQFPFIHQNVVKIHLGESFAVNKGIDVFDSMTQKQGTYVKSDVIYPTGLVESSSDDLHSAIFNQTADLTNEFTAARFVDKYVGVGSIKGSSSRIGLSFVIGI
ncbi:MAG: ABC transporter permease, partial [Clostridia bacterium]|nr:ABC transporter permease [Clostridia bacterium]